MSTAQETSVTSKTPAWEREGLPGMPGFMSGNKLLRWVPLEDLIRDDMGKIITAPASYHAEKLISDHLGKTIEPVTMIIGTPYAKIVDDVVFRYTGTGRLSFMERKAAATLAWVATTYYPPMKRRENTVFPTALDDLPKELRSPRLRVQMWKAFTEDKAIQVAGVLEAVFPEIEATVFEDGDGWFVAIDAGAKEFDDVAELERVETILWMLSEFDVVPNDESMVPYGAGLNVDLDKDEHIEGRAVRAFNAYATQQRIEDGINAILAHLGHPGADGKENAPMATTKRGKGIDALLASTTKPAGKKSSAKRSA